MEIHGGLSVKMVHPPHNFLGKHFVTVLKFCIRPFPTILLLCINIRSCMYHTIWLCVYKLQVISYLLNSDLPILSAPLTL